MTDFTIEPMSWKDFTVIRQLEQDCFGVDAHFILDILGMLSLPGYIRLKAVEGDLVIGFIVGEVSADRDASWISAIGVKPSYRRQGVGQALMAACEAKFRKPIVRLCVKVGNTPAINLYEQKGYRHVKRIKNYYESGDAFMMEKDRRLKS